MSNLKRSLVQAQSLCRFIPVIFLRSVAVVRVAFQSVCVFVKLIISCISFSIVPFFILTLNQNRMLNPVRLVLLLLSLFFLLFIYFFYCFVFTQITTWREMCRRNVINVCLIYRRKIFLCYGDGFTLNFNTSLKFAFSCAHAADTQQQPALFSLPSCCTYMCHTVINMLHMWLFCTNTML